MENNQNKRFTRATKLVLVVYCLLMAVCIIAFAIVTGITKNTSYMCGFSLCLGPSIFFVTISLFFPVSRLFDAKVGKSVIVWYVIGYVLKYAAVIGFPFIGLVHPEVFNKWVMLATTLIAPITVIVSKLIIANYVSKSAKKDQK